MSPPPSPPPLDDPLAELVDALQPRPDRAPVGRRVVGIAGCPGAGKSTLASHLAHAVNQACGEQVAMALGMDGFHLPRDRLASMPDPAAALARRGAPWTFDPQALARRLWQVREAPRGPEADPVGWPGFEHGVGDPVPDALAVPPCTRLVLLEGLYLLHDADGWNLRALMDRCWFLDTPLEVSLQRLARRHQQAWGISAQEALRRIDANDRPNALIVLQGRLRADALVPDTGRCTS